MLDVTSCWSLEGPLAMVKTDFCELSRYYSSYTGITDCAELSVIQSLLVYLDYRRLITDSHAAHLLVSAGIQHNTMNGGCCYCGG